MRSSPMAPACLASLGRTCGCLGEWPHGPIVAAAIAAIEREGSTASGRTGTPAGELEVIRYRLGRCQLELCVEDYGEVTLRGSRALAAALAEAIAPMNR